MLENGSILKADGRQYQILEMLGRGANTIAYLANCHSGELKYKCILKEYAPQNNDDFDTGKQRFIIDAYSDGVRIIVKDDKYYYLPEAQNIVE